MRILFTGASSFTGTWFVRELAAAGHDVVATFRRTLDGYEGMRAERVAEVARHADTRPGVCFGDDAFLALVSHEGPWDVLCHHAAEVGDYKSPDFDVASALAANTYQLPEVLSRLSEGGCRRVVLTGSVFERGEGAGSGDLPAFSPYGLSKTFTAETFRWHAAQQGLRLGKFVIPNPFGPLDEPRFTAYLVRCWRQGEVPAVNTPAYVRDNIHVSLLARCYVRFVETLDTGVGFRKLSPSGYVESQGAFAQRFAREFESRLGLPCPLELHPQKSFPEPRVRINVDVPDAEGLDWNESSAWDDLVSHPADPD